MHTLHILLEVVLVVMLVVACGGGGVGGVRVRRQHLPPVVYGSVH